MSKHTRGTLHHACPVHPPAQPSPQQRFEQMFRRDASGSLRFARVLQPLPIHQYNAGRQLHHVLHYHQLPTVPPPPPPPTIISAAAHHDPFFPLCPHLSYQHFGFLPYQSNVVHPCQHSRCMSPVFVGGHGMRPNVVPTFPAKFAFSPPFIPQYTDHHQYQPLHSVQQPRIFSPCGIIPPIQFPSPPYSVIANARSSHELKKCSSQEENRDDPIIISEDEGSAPPLEAEKVTDLVSFDYVELETTDTITTTTSNSSGQFSSAQQHRESAAVSLTSSTVEPQVEPQPPLGTTLEKPPYSFSAMIGMAIMSSSSKELSVRDIYNFISNIFPYYNRSKRAWKNSVRHCLTTSNCFKQVFDESGNATRWTINKTSGKNFMKGSFQKSKKIKKRYQQQHLTRPRTTIQHRSDTSTSNAAAALSLDSIWLMYADELQIKTIPNSDVEIYELVPPDTPPPHQQCSSEGAYFETFIG